MALGLVPVVAARPVRALIPSRRQDLRQTADGPVHLFGHHLDDGMWDHQQFG